MHTVFNPAQVSREGLVEQAQDPTAPEGLLFAHAKEGKPLATPWQVASLRANLLAQHRLDEGWVLDCACGSGIQLAAYASTLERPVLGVELESARAQASAANLQTVAMHQRATESAWFSKSRILAGDGTAAQQVMALLEDKASVSLLHLDPARPRNSRTHALDEMQPPLHRVLNAWAPYFAGEPALILDLSPRLTLSQRTEVEGLVEAVWPNLSKTWEWTSRGRGRVDRLALWAGQVAESGIQRRFVRVPPSLSDPAFVLRTSEAAQAISPTVHPPKRGEYVSLLDAALVESGLASTWLGSVSKEQRFRWGVVEGRRPQLHHDHPLRLTEQDAWMVQATGRVVDLLPMDLDETTVDEVVARSLEHNFKSVKLRLDIDPDLQPKVQGSLDRQLQRRHGERDGFLARHPTAKVLLLCVSHSEQR